MSKPGPGRPRLAPAALVAAIAVSLLAGCSGTPPSPAHPAASSGRAATTGASAVPATPPPVTITGYYHQKLAWRPCDKVFRCARLLVPFDYHRPAWRRFSLPVIKLPATSPGQRIGSLVINPGGPGGSGVAYALQARSVVSAAVRARFDVVGFDPRGVGASIPAIHCLTGPQLDKYFATDAVPTTRAEMNALIAESKLFARGCERNSGGLLPWIGTRNAARDMDVLRSALGDAKLTYLGKSYGTYLGSWYAQLFPTHVRALVLDGAVDPDAPSLSLNVTQADGFEVALRSFTSDCLRRASCPLGHGGTVGTGLSRLRQLLDRATRHPLANDLHNGQPGNGTLLLGGVVAALYDKAAWPLLRDALSTAFNGNGTLLIELGDSLMERSPGGTYTNLADANMAIDCVDRPWPHALAAWRAAAAAAGKAAPQFGVPIMWGSLPCAYWPVRSAPLPRLTARGAPPILVVGTTRDPATPYRWAQALAGDLTSGVLLGWNGDGHTAYLMGSSCVDSIVDRYLISRAVPRSGTVCG